jgi:hypothetical protein
MPLIRTSRISEFTTVSTCSADFCGVAGNPTRLGQSSSEEDGSRLNSLGQDLEGGISLPAAETVFGPLLPACGRISPSDVARSLHDLPGQCSRSRRDA